MKTKILVLIGVVLALLAGIVFMNNANNTLVERRNEIQRLQAVIDGYEKIDERKLQDQERRDLVRGTHTVSDDEYEQFLRWKHNYKLERKGEVTLCATETKDKTVLMVKACE